jgi:predicted secreted hydrolase
VRKVANTLSWIAMGLVGVGLVAVGFHACAPEVGRKSATTPRGAQVGEAAREALSFQTARGTRVWRFPRDHAAHPAYGTEWWYATGIVRTPEGRLFGYELTFFRVGLAPPRAGEPLGAPPPPPISPWRARDLLLAHAAVTDVEGRRFVVEESFERAARGWAGADTLEMDVWIGGWRAAGWREGFVLTIPAASTGGRLGLELSLRSPRPPVLHGRGGLSTKDARAEPHASWYASLPRLETSGRLSVGGESFPVVGVTWMDHEFFSGGLSGKQAGWDWFSCRLEGGRDLMLFRLRTSGGETDHVAGTVSAADGETWRSLQTAGAAFEPLERWTSPASGANYPTAWRIRLPAEGLELRSRTPLAEQEVVAKESVGFSYWEGLVAYTGVWKGEELRGEGYVEMTGYDAPVRLP